VIGRLSAALAAAVPHRWAAALVHGTVLTPEGERDGAAPDSAEMSRLAEQVTPGIPWHGTAVLGGTAQTVLALASAEPAAAGCVLALAGATGTAGAELAQRLWEVAVARLKTIRSLDIAAPPLYLAAGRLAAGEHAKALTAAKDTYAATLMTILAALRSRRLHPDAARDLAISIASTAVIDLRATPGAGERSAGEAFASLAERLQTIARHGGIDLELAPPHDTGRLLPPAIADAARSVVRGCVLTMLEHTSPTRIRVGWEAAEADLRISVRADGDGALFPQALAEYRLRERLTGLGGDFSLDAVAGWGTTVTARLPLAPPPTPGTEALDALSPRELEVLAELASGQRNRDIAARLHITEHTAKFHIANILSKLGVQTRGQAAAFAREARL
jgi:DNA-binding CsgD family transcriptional regulator